MSGMLSVSNLGKAYRKWGSEWARVASWFGIRVKPAEEHWVIRDISFSIGPGETVGIVGQNGAGKSTLLKLITGTAHPTEGQVSRAGRIAAILELGMGFNAELSGRENVFHSAGLMGYSQEQIEAVMPEIEAFAEIGEYFDQQVRTYSSGMQMRVSFAVATAFRPDVLIVDEALSVGDSYFQHKSFKRIREFREMGTTLLIVSHDASAIQAICDRAILLDGGKIVRDGAPDDVMDYYNALIAERENASLIIRKHESGRDQIVSGTGEAIVDQIGLYDHDGNPVEMIDVGQCVELRIKVRAVADIARLVLGYMIKDRLGQPVFGTNTHYTKQHLDTVSAGMLVNFKIKFDANLGAGSYSVSTALVSTETHLVNNYEWRELALTFTVANISKPDFVGTAWVPPHIEIVS
ncbi:MULTISPECIES: ABC transporter ATP-binding protein [Xanthomonas]|uniref:ABC transporter ATP-binding protein n=1 Tax=Xanthomonas TaxID=338 RepID=UPI0006E5DB41|nr:MULTISPECIES: ABC transporter ATP-binding protein [Xanthomonas]MBO9749305.1 ABC transporter ATP-binding protein [Xanthomonas phaseoli pv. dieffenbachiae]MBO9750575.1 ABC transporter ATP-binding protein [Xanthomonas phaseoli pv. dieffenbachiae]MBO9879435.1 ABC transporter ATP-binding protein [Xanthomonas sp. D-99]MBO9891258.1 ABC transporter ATP-binding protein [Xanthomonas sp. D-36-1]OQP71348.1 sugar ABC transporter ATP-binding protein [Xanthomonas citri]